MRIKQGRSSLAWRGTACVFLSARSHDHAGERHVPDCREAADRGDPGRGRHDRRSEGTTRGVPSRPRECLQVLRCQRCRHIALHISAGWRCFISAQADAGSAESGVLASETSLRACLHQDAASLVIPPTLPSAQVHFNLSLGRAFGGSVVAKPIMLWLDPFLRTTLADLIVWPNRIVVPLSYDPDFDYSVLEMRSVQGGIVFSEH